MEPDLSISKINTYEYHTRVYLDWVGEPYIWCAYGNYPQHIFRLQEGDAYHPDFYLPRLDTYIDPKGFVRKGYYEDKYRRVEEEYPGRVQIFLGKTYLEQLKMFLKNQIKLHKYPPFILCVAKE